MRRRNDNPLGWSALSCALAGAGLYLLYRKFKGLGESYELSMPALPVPSEASPSQIRVVSARQQPRAARASVAQAYAAIPAPATYVPTGTPSTKTFVKPTITKNDYKIYEPGQFDVTGVPAKATPTTTAPAPTPRGTTTASEKKDVEAEMAEEIDLQKKLIKGDLESALKWTRELAPAIQEFGKKTEEAKRRAAALPEGTADKWIAENDAMDAEISAISLARNLHIKVAEKYRDTDNLIMGTVEMAKSSGLGDARAKEVELELRQHRDKLAKKYWLVPDPNPEALGEAQAKLEMQLAMRRGTSLE